MSNIIPVNFGPVSSKFASVKIENDAAAGIEGGYAVVKYKGKVWKIDFRGEEKPIMRPDGDGPANSIEVVFVSASPVKSKIYYPNYTDGSNEQPTCFSGNGVTPDPRALNKQAESCAACPMNVSGSKVDETGQARGKACRDNKRVAILPAADLHNELYGGPMLLRIPAASLNDFAMFTRKLEQLGLPYCAVVVKIAFDVNEAYPKFTFSGVRTLTDEEADIILKWRDEPIVKTIIAETAAASLAADPQVAALTPPPAAMQKVAPAATQAVAPKSAVAPKPAPAPEPASDEPVAEVDAQATGTSLDDELEKLLA